MVPVDRRVSTDSPVRLDPTKRIVKPDTQTSSINVGNVNISFEVANSIGSEPFFCLGVRKSGSTVLHKIITFLASKNSINTVDLPGRFFKEGLTFAQFNDVDVSFVIKPGNIYSGFRAYPKRLGELSSFKESKKIYMFRDPRDALVSQYFSDAYSHTLPKEQSTEEAKGRDLFLQKRQDALQTDIDEWVLKRAGSIRNTLNEYVNLFDDQKTLIIRYEDFIFQKERFIKKMLIHFGWSLSPSEMHRLLSLVDIVPNAEDKTQFVRKAIPGDYRAKLKRETINRLNNRLAEILKIYDY